MLLLQTKDTAASEKDAAVSFWFIFLKVPLLTMLG